MNYIPHRVLFVVSLIMGLILLYLINDYWKRLRTIVLSRRIRDRISNSLKDTETLADSIVMIRSMLTELINDNKSTIDDALIIWRDGQNFRSQQLLENNNLPLSIEEYINNRTVYSKKALSLKKSKNGHLVYLQLENDNSAIGVIKVILFFRTPG